MQLHIDYTAQFKKDLKKAKKSGKNLALLYNVAQTIINQKLLPAKLKDHILIGNWKNHRELHISNDWLLIYRIIPNENTVIFVRTGTHSDLFC